MTTPRYARLLADIFKRGETRVNDHLPAHSNRDEEVTLIEQAMDRKRQRSRHFRLAARWSLAIAAVVAGVGSWRVYGQRTALPPIAQTGGVVEKAQAPASVVVAIASGSGAIVASPGSSTPVVAGRALQAGSRLIVDPGAGATLSLSTGTHLEVEPGSQLTVVEDSRAQIFALNAGSLRADVAKLGNSERFIVRTADAEVEVRGTSFLVGVVAPDPACAGGTTTRVTVYEGVVVVRKDGQEDSIRRGEHWPRGCRATTATLVPSPRPASKRGAKVETPVFAAHAQPTPAPAAQGQPTPASDIRPAANGNPLSPPASIRRGPSSSLAEENNLFAEGVLARRQGNTPLALARMERFLERYPASHLAENAAAERMRLLRPLDPAKAAAAARQYLLLYPAGFARGDAEAILVGTH